MELYSAHVWTLCRLAGLLGQTTYLYVSQLVQNKLDGDEICYRKTRHIIDINCGWQTMRKRPGDCTWSELP